MYFNQVYKRTSILEGGYANNPSDKGGETYCGIARRFHPDWFGWKTVDRIKKGAGGELPNNFKIPILEDDVRVFYKRMFWDKIYGDQMLDEDIAAEVYDTAVNCEISVASRFLQRTLNVLNRNQRDWSDLKVDGMIGPDTIHKLKTAIRRSKIAVIVKILTILRGSYYIDIAERRNDQEIWIENWIGRLQCS